MTVVEKYLSTVPEPERLALERIRKIVHETVPGAEEVMTYGMPGFKYQGKYLVSFAAFRDHLSLFPGAFPDKFRDELKDFTLSKGTIQFTLDHPVPEPIIKELLENRVNEIGSGKKVTKIT